MLCSIEGLVNRKWYPTNGLRSCQAAAHEEVALARPSRALWGHSSRSACRRRMAAICVRREKAALSSGCKPHPTNAPNRKQLGAVMEVTKWLKPSVTRSHIGDGASVRTATRLNAEQASKRTMCRPTR